LPTISEERGVERVKAACARALDYLASKQRADGGWVDNQAVNALALLAFMGRGHVPERGPFRDVLARGKKYILNSGNSASGFLSYSTMYEHGLATLALAEMYGTDPDPILEEKLRKAIDLIVRVQSLSGGWNYSPMPGEGDLSVTVMQIVALRAARNADISVPQKTIEKAIAYVRRHAHPAGGFGYTGPGQGPQTTAAGILSMQLLGQQDDPSVKAALPILAAVPVAWGHKEGPQYFYYFHYYAIQAQYQAGGKTWDDWHPRIRELLLSKQNRDGSWDCPPLGVEKEEVVGPEKIYWTAMASLVLEIYLHYLPAYQR
jgi:hypothetical protein